MVCLKDPVIQQVCQLYDQISNLQNLNPSKEVDSLFTQLVQACIPPYPMDVTNLCTKIQQIRTNLIRLCGQAESLLEKHYSTILISSDNPLHHLHLFPYYNNYLKLSKLEFDLLTPHAILFNPPRRVAFIGSGPLPLTSIVLATHHLTSTFFHNYDIDDSANSLASRLVHSDPDLSKRMLFHTKDVLNMSAPELHEYDVVFLAALVGMEMEQKMLVINHLSKNMAPGAILMLRSAHGARAFLYPVVEPRHLQGGFEVLSVFHPTDEVINSVVIARKTAAINPAVHSVDHVHQAGFGSLVLQPLINCTKCGQNIPSNFNTSPMNMIDQE
ncbi:nicotianamine synthase-like [Henckelia pumila]|uniref:nicotianamine synthase-like n=1 Tax=Henckelia pumila TaxID=405737 RepID=UPI003C6E7E6E